MSVIRMVKLFGWEGKMSTRLDKKREEELQWVWTSRMYNLAISNTKLVSMSFAFIFLYWFTCSFILPMVTMLTTFGTYVGHTVAYIISSFLNRSSRHWSLKRLWMLPLFSRLLQVYLSLCSFSLMLIQLQYSGSYKTKFAEYSSLFLLSLRAKSPLTALMTSSSMYGSALTTSHSATFKTDYSSLDRAHRQIFAWIWDHCGDLNRELLNRNWLLFCPVQLVRGARYW